MSLEPSQFQAIARSNQTIRSDLIASHQDPTVAPTEQGESSALEDDENRDFDNGVFCVGSIQLEEIIF